MSEPLDTLDKDRKAMSEAIKKDIEKDKENLARVRADEDTIDDDAEYGDDDKLRDEILGVMEELCDTPMTALTSKKSCAWALRFQLRSNF